MDAIKVLKVQTNATSYLDIFNVNTLNIGTLSECSTVIGNSLILRATITTNLESIEQESNVIVIPSTSYEINETFNEKYLSSTEVSAMFTSLTKLFGESVSVDAINQMANIEVTKVKESMALVTTSDVLRATITSNLKVSLDGQSSTINVLEDSVSKAKNNNGNDIVILTADELNDIVNAIYTISSDGTLSFDLNLNTLFIVAANSDVILASDMITLAISDYLIEGVNTPYGKLSYSYVMLSDPINSQNVVEIPSGSINNKPVLTKEQILLFIAKLQEYFPQN